MAYYECMITVKRRIGDNSIKTYEINSDDLVPGDIFVVPSNTKMPCDAIVITGSAIVNESMLTGESIPVFKSELPRVNNMIYNPEEHTKYTLYSGTQVLQCRKTSKEDVTAMVIRTNFNTTKGALVKSILYPKPSRFNFYNDALKFIAIMGLVTIVGWGVTIDASLKYLSLGATFKRALDLVTITVPPALPAVMSIGTIFAVSRLRSNKIYCISPPSVNTAGRVRTIVFDKTGTLTEEGLEVAGLR